MFVRPGIKTTRLSGYFKRAIAEVGSFAVPSPCIHRDVDSNGTWTSTVHRSLAKEAALRSWSVCAVSGRDPARRRSDRPMRLDENRASELRRLSRRRAGAHIPDGTYTGTHRLSGRESPEPGEPLGTESGVEAVERKRETSSDRHLQTLLLAARPRARLSLPLPALRKAGAIRCRAPRDARLWPSFRKQAQRRRERLE
jgi:hypothetical protein